jgi:hypothetical protein
MLKLTSAALGFLTLISIVPSVQAAPLFDRPNDSPAPNVRAIFGTRASQPEIKVIVNPQARPEIHPAIYRDDRFNNRYDRRESEYRYRQELARRREREIEREREARARWEAAHRRHHGYYSQQPVYAPVYHPSAIEHREDNGGYYRRDR